MGVVGTPWHWWVLWRQDAGQCCHNVHYAQLCNTFYISSVPGTRLQLKCLLFRFEAILLEFLQFSGSPGQDSEVTTLKPAPRVQPWLVRGNCCCPGFSSPAAFIPTKKIGVRNKWLLNLAFEGSNQYILKLHRLLKHFYFQCLLMPIVCSLLYSLPSVRGPCMCNHYPRMFVVVRRAVYCHCDAVTGLSRIVTKCSLPQSGYNWKTVQHHCTYVVSCWGGQEE